ncbi:unnamed protein product [Ascophyllum nodosum]
MSEASASQVATVLNNLPQGDEYMVNNRKEILHVRSYAPADPAEIRALVTFVHGYGGHISVPPKVQLGSAMPSRGIAMIQLDLPGHGYSQGERAWVKSYHHWIEDYFQLLEAIAGGGFSSESAGKLNLSASHLERMKSVPFFLTGESLGAGLALLTGLTLHDRQHPLLPRFKGVGLIAPAIRGNPPPSPVIFALRYCVVPFLPRTQVPNFLESVKIPEEVWKKEEDRALAKRDGWGRPGGIGWNHNMKFNMAMNMLDMIGVVSTRLSDVVFPFTIMHDPKDAIVQFASSRELVEKASTPREDPRARELKEMPGWLHDLLTNCPDMVIEHLTGWILHQTERSS